MKRFAEIENGVAKNVLVAKQEADLADFPGTFVEVTGTKVGPGWLYDGSVFSAPPPVEPEEVLVDTVDFLDMFTFDELVAIETAAETDAEIRVAMQYLDAAGGKVDLKSPKVAAYVGILEGKGVINQGRSNEVRQGQKKQ